MFVTLVFAIYLVMMHIATYSEEYVSFSDFKAYSVVSLLISVVISFAVHGVCTLFGKNFFF